jgi:hypothetical protein
MEHANCDACLARTPARAPASSFLALIGSFWILSLALGFATTAAGSWGFLAGLSWALLATSVVLLARRATTWTCAECGSSVAPPVTARTLPKAGAYRAMQPRHA